MTSHGDKEGTTSATSGLKIFIWNVNGIRSFEDFPERLQNTNADIICIQETKVGKYMIPVCRNFSRLIFMPGDEGHADRGHGHHSRLHLLLLLLTPEVRLQRGGHLLPDVRHAHRG